MTRKILILHTGIPQLISQLAYIYKNDLSKDVYGVVRMYTALDTKNPQLDEAEQWIFNLFDLELLGRTKAIVRVWGNNKYEKFLSLFFLKHKIKKYLKRNTKIDLKGTTDVITPYKPIIDFVLMLGMFKNISTHYMAEGTSIDFLKDFKIPFYLNLLGIKNVFSKSNNLIINSSPELYNSVKRFGSVSLIDDSSINHVLKKIRDNKNLVLWQKENQLDAPNINQSLLVLQPLDRWLPLINNIEFYKEIVKLEEKKRKNKIIVKFHPRETSKNILAFQKAFISNENVCFFSNSFLSYLPLEIYFTQSNIKRIIGYCSTALFLAKNNDKVEALMYYSNQYPDVINKGARRMSKELIIGLEEVETSI